MWFVDRTAATYTDILSNKPMSVLRYMCSPGRFNPLGTYVQSGGRVWLAGGGAATVTIDAYNREPNDDPGSRNYTGEEGELAPGRVLWDAAHWRSGMTSSTSFVTVVRAPRAEAIADAPWSHEDHWTGGLVHSPDYRRLPAELRYRTPESDPLPPTRQARQASSYYSTSGTSEFLFLRNDIEEDVDLSEEGVRMASTLDTLIELRSFLLKRSPAPAMTWYHGAQANRFVMTGFAPWAFHRADCIALTDFVLQDLWGLSRAPVDRGTRVSPEASRNTRPAGRVSSRATRGEGP